MMTAQAKSISSTAISEPVRVLTDQGQPLLMLLLCFASMSLGWRIRGQFGHEIGAAIAGILGALSVVLCAGNRNYLPRAASIALLGGIGWAFGGSISYMKVVGFTESSQSATVLYGFAGLFLIGFLWSFLGAGGTALGLSCTGSEIQSVLRILLLLCLAWFLQDVCLDILQQRGIQDFDWYGSDWIAAAVALLTASGVQICCRGRDFGARLALWMTCGWWIVFVLLVPLAGIRLNPPRGDNWAGCIGLVAGLIGFCIRTGFFTIVRASLITGFIGGALFCVGQMAKLGFIATGHRHNWHAVMEFIHGGFFGIALVAGILPVLRKMSCIGHERDEEYRGGLWPSWCGTFCISFILWVIPYLNFRKSPDRWVKEFSNMKNEFYGLLTTTQFMPSRRVIGWMEVLFLLWGIILIPQLVRRRKLPIALIPESPFGRVQLLFLTFAWFMTWISFTSEISQMSPEHFTIQWGISAMALISTLLLFRCHDPECRLNPTAAAESKLSHVVSDSKLEADPKPSGIRQLIAENRTVLLAGVISFVLVSSGAWMWKRMLFGDQYTGFFPNNHIRFGPENTNQLK